MAADDVIERLWEASQSGDTLRREWLEELVWHRDGKERLRVLGRTADAPTLIALMDLLHDYADASRRNASKKRRKTIAEGESWQRELAAHLHREGLATKRAKYLHIPQEHDAEPLSLVGGKFEVTRSGNINAQGKDGPRIRCTFDDGRPPAEITLSTFERYLKMPSTKEKRGG